MSSLHLVLLDCYAALYYSLFKHKWQNLRASVLTSRSHCNKCPRCNVSFLLFWVGTKFSAESFFLNRPTFDNEFVGYGPFISVLPENHHVCLYLLLYYFWELSVLSPLQTPSPVAGGTELISFFLRSECETQSSPQSSYWARFVALSWRCGAHSSQHLEAFSKSFLLFENWRSLAPVYEGVAVQERFPRWRFPNPVLVCFQERSSPSWNLAARLLFFLNCRLYLSKWRLILSQL